MCFLRIFIENFTVSTNFTTMKEDTQALFEQIVTQFEADGYQHAKKFDSMPNTLSSFKILVKEEYEYLDAFLGQFIQYTQSQEKRIDCRKGCDTCCHQAVFLSPSEAVYLYAYIKKHLPSDLQDKIYRRTVLKQKKTRNMAAREYLRYRQACPLLDSNTGACMAHITRPVACRIFLSADVNTCEAAHTHPGDVNLFAALYDLPLRAGQALNTGFNQYLHETGIQSPIMKMEDALLVCFENPQHAREWLDKKDVFNEGVSDTDITYISTYGKVKKQDKK